MWVDGLLTRVGGYSFKGSPRPVNTMTTFRSRRWTHTYLDTKTEPRVEYISMSGPMDMSIMNSSLREIPKEVWED